CRADADRTRADFDPRNRHEGADRPRLALARRPPVGARGDRLLGLDGGHPDPRRLAQPLPDLVADLHHGVARGPDTRRIGSALVPGGRLRRHSRRARDAGRLPGGEVTDQELLARADAIAVRAYSPYSTFEVGCA